MHGNAKDLPQHSEISWLLLSEEEEEEEELPQERFPSGLRILIAVVTTVVS